MRTSFSPNRLNVPVPPAPDISLTVVTHRTNDPWHNQRTEIVRLSLQTMLAGAQSFKTELIIWDNGSTPEFRAMLREFKPFVLVESGNIGVWNARRNLCRMARGRMVSFADDDLLYAPDWLRKQYEILTTYPNVGLVAGSPQRAAFNGGIEPMIEFAKRDDVKSWKGKLIPAEWEQDFAKSIGAKKEYDYPGTDLLLEYCGRKAWAHGHHMQFLCYKNVVEPYIIPSQYLLENANINVRLSKTGVLQLTTFNREVVHIGNTIDPSIDKIQKEFAESPREDPF